MRYASVCSGIEAPSVAWKPLGWEPVWFSEIEPFPKAVLAHHYPDVPDLGDMTKIHENEVFKNEPIDLLTGGTPCQAFSVAGLRRGLADPRGNLALEYLRLADTKRPKWLLWENVPGVISSWSGADAPGDLEPGEQREATETSDFGCFLEALRQLGYGFAYRSFDAQYFGVAQRRERVFVVGYLGDWRPAAAVLFEPESLRGNPPPCRETGQGTTAPTAPSLTASGRGVSRTGESRGQDPVVATVPTLTSNGDAHSGFRDEHGLVPHAFKIRGGCEGGGKGYLGQDEMAFTLSTNQDQHIAHTLRGEGFDASEDGSGRGIPLTVGTLCADSHPGHYSGQDAYTGRLIPAPHAPSISMCLNAGGMGRQDAESETLLATFDPRNVTSKANRTKVEANRPANTLHAQAQALIGAGVRRLTPTECERLMGQEDGYTLVPYRGKPAADGPRYKSLGNSQVTKNMAWIGRRIQAYEDGLL